MQRASAKLNLIPFTEGVLYAQGSGPRPYSVMFGGRTYYRFHDFIYVSSRIELLNEQQVVAVCTLRDRFATTQQLAPNRVVRGHLRAVIETFAPRLLLELGPGNRPLYPHYVTNFRYELIEIDRTITRNLMEQGYSIDTFFNSATPTLTNGSVDLIVAAFVFQFFLSTQQIEELTRVLDENGLIVANVYGRTAISREELKNTFKRNELEVKTISGDYGIGYNHEYWALGRNLQDFRCASAIAALCRM